MEALALGGFFGEGVDLGEPATEGIGEGDELAVGAQKHRCRVPARPGATDRSMSMILAYDTVRNFALIAGGVQAQLNNITRQHRELWPAPLGHARARHALLPGWWRGPGHRRMATGSGQPLQQPLPTAIQIIDPACLCNPSGLMDADHCAGVKLNPHVHMQIGLTQRPTPAFDDKFIGHFRRDRSLVHFGGSGDSASDVHRGMQSPPSAGEPPFFPESNAHDS
uniref:Uncharacterized protein n=1 Tax=Candidatus Kentrum sp. DK TaxID=2126562 RepID=A0A450S3A5_9GAMM|nr:MAG: hypothetical protein BECKDK2373B_GA0170837_101246 [Candidatus Kentron sp. DK]